MIRYIVIINCCCCCCLYYILILYYYNKNNKYELEVGHEQVEQIWELQRKNLKIDLREANDLGALNYMNIKFALST